MKNKLTVIVKPNKGEKNPFYNNHIFTEFDLEKVKIKWWQYPLLWLLPTYVQTNDGYAFFYKLWQGKWFLMKEEKI